MIFAFLPKQWRPVVRLIFVIILACSNLALAEIVKMEKHMSPEQEQSIVASALQRASAGNEVDNFLAEVKATLSTNPKFWFDYAHALSTLPMSHRMDIRAEGRLAAAVVAIEQAAAIDPKHIAIWGERLVIQRYLAHGLSAFLNASAVASQQKNEQSERAKLALAQFKQTLDDAVAHFPNDEWFREERQEAYEDFGWQATK